MTTFVGTAGGQVPKPTPPGTFDRITATGRLDELVLVELKRRNLPPSDPCTDEVFLRRVFLDALGTLPTPPEVRRFLADRKPDKRCRLVDGLLDRPEFADCLGLRWGDLLRVKSEFPSNLWPHAAQGYDRWIRTCFRTQMPYDVFARTLLTASGSNFRVPPANFYRAFQERTPRQMAETVALVFLGTRPGPAGWTESQLQGFSACFAKVAFKGTDEWKEEIVFSNPDGKLLDPATGRPVPPALPDGTPLPVAPDEDPRPALAAWLTAPDNPWFARAMVNRIWAWTLGRGLVHEPDDLRPGNPPWNADLLDFLARELVQSHYDLRRVYALILCSRTYQTASEANAMNAGDDSGISHYRTRRLDAEPLLDAINQALGTGERYVSSIPEPFTFLPGDQRAIALPDGSIESPFLELFGRPSRNTSFASERSAAPTVFQAQHLLNASHIQRKLEQSTVLRQLANQVKDPAQQVETLYLRILSRFPTEDEQRSAVAHLSAAARPLQESLGDLAWALLNTKEFVLQH